MSENIDVKVDEPVFVEEGLAKIQFPNQNEVFYNPVQHFNRDMSVLIITTFNKLREAKLKEKFIKKNPEKADKKPILLEALAATGLRSIRYYKEIPSLGMITINDLEPQAVDAMKVNLELNNIPLEKVNVNLGDAMDPLKRFDIIDLDPYGSASPFLDAAVQSIADGGLLLVTCTDLAVLASQQHQETCYTKYGGTPLKSSFCHEAALRLVINAVKTSAARYKRSVTPLISCSIDFYVRIFMMVDTSPAAIKLNASQTSVVYKCSGCHTFDLSPISRAIPNEKGYKFTPTQGPPVGPNCEHCGSKLHMGGPMYSGPLHDNTFVKEALNTLELELPNLHTYKRIEGMLTVISEELDVPLFHLPTDLFSTIKSSTPPLKILASALLNLDYKVSASHCAAGSIKTDAPNNVIWDIMRHHVKLNPVKMANFAKGAPGLKILSKEPTLDTVSFDLHKNADPKSRNIKLVRYQMNPTKHWGPKAKHQKIKKLEDETNGVETNKEL